MPQQIPFLHTQPFRFSHSTFFHNANIILRVMVSSFYYHHPSYGEVNVQLFVCMYCMYILMVMLVCLAKGFYYFRILCTFCTNEQGENMV